MTGVQTCALPISLQNVKQGAEGEESQLWKGTRGGKAQQTRLNVVMRIKVFASPKSFWRSGLSLPGTMRKTPLQMEISLTNVKVSYKRMTLPLVCSISFRSPVS